MHLELRPRSREVSSGCGHNLAYGDESDASSLMTTYSSSTAGVHGRATARGAGHTRTSAPAYHIIICLINIIYM